MASTLSHALHPAYVNDNSPRQQYAPYPHNAPNGHHRHEEEEEEEDEDEDAVEGHLDGRADSTKPAISSDPPVVHTPSEHDSTLRVEVVDPNLKRKPGRPKGSRTKKPRETTTPNGPAHPAFKQFPATAVPADVHPQHQPYYDFQWRILNLCSEFYTAAEELIKGTQPLVIAQSYQMGPGAHIDPLQMLGDAKRICDTLMANPSQLVSRPPPPMYPVHPAYTTAPPPAPTPSSSSPPAQPPYSGAPPPMAYPTMYAPPGAPQYPTAPYYSGGPTPYYAPYAPHPPHPPHAHPPPPAASSSSARPSAAGATTFQRNGKEGAWSDDETERLRALAEESRAAGAGGEVDWDWVIARWGHSRTRHQILIKATGMGLKESTTRPTKRRRDETPEPTASPPPPQQPKPTTPPPQQQPQQQLAWPAGGPGPDGFYRTPGVDHGAKGFYRTPGVEHTTPVPPPPAPAPVPAPPMKPMTHYMYTPNGQGGVVRSAAAKT